jgi:hypothetical protein
MYSAGSVTPRTATATATATAVAALTLAKVEAQ